MEREVVITGIGGQGIQLMAKVLAHAAKAEGRYVMLFGMYMGMMRGGSSDSTVVLGDAEIGAPPIIPHTWSVLAMHPMGLPGLLPKLRPGGFLLANGTLVHEAPEHDGVTTSVPATELAEKAGNILGAGMVALGAFVALTGLVGADALAQAMADSLPPHRRHLAEANLGFLETGARHVASFPPLPAWSAPARGNAS